MDDDEKQEETLKVTVEPGDRGHQSISSITDHFNNLTG